MLTSKYLIITIILIMFITCMAITFTHCIERSMCRPPSQADCIDREARKL